MDITKLKITSLILLLRLNIYLSYDMLAHADTVGYVQINQYWYKSVYNLPNITEDLTIISVILVSYSGNFSSYFNINYTFSSYVDHLSKSHLNFIAINLV